MHSTLPLCSAADWRDTSPAPFSHYAPWPTHSLVRELMAKWQVRLPCQCCRDCGQKSVLHYSISLGACVTVLPCRAARRRARQSCAAWTSIESGNWKCVERRLHHRCYLLILVCKGSYYPAVTAATCIRLLTSVCFLLVLPPFISALASALFLV